tara:strand:+ start:154 stop:408 length:255 start_codon:yes stop_codon:yes gene_type:complete
MKKNGKTLSVSEIEEYKTQLQTDFEKVQTQMQNVDNMKVQLTAQGNALSGAMQQCDVFLNLLGEANPASSIPSQDDSAVQTALS